MMLVAISCIISIMILYASHNVLSHFLHFMYRLSDIAVDRRGCKQPHHCVMYFVHCLPLFFHMQRSYCLQRRATYSLLFFVAWNNIEMMVIYQYLFVTESCISAYIYICIYICNITHYYYHQLNMCFCTSYVCFAIRWLWRYWLLEHR